MYIYIFTKEIHTHFLKVPLLGYEFLPVSDRTDVFPLQYIEIHTFVNRKNIMKLLTCLLFDEKVLLFSKNYRKLSICVLTLIDMLQPLVYL